MSSVRRLLLTTRTLFILVVIDLGFWALGFERTYGWLARLPRRSPQALDAVDQAEVDRAFQAVLDASKLYYRKRLDCLPKALTTFHLLRSKGIPAELCIGVKRFPFTAHAWVELQDRIIDEIPSRIAEYTVMTRLPKEATP